MARFLRKSSLKRIRAHKPYKTVCTMKKALLGLALLTTLTTVSFAADARKEKKAKRVKAKSEKCEKSAGHACCMKKAQV